VEIYPQSYSQKYQHPFIPTLNAWWWYTRMLPVIMAQRRLLNKKISVSEQVAGLSIEAQLIFTWSIPHADDIGLLPFSPMKFKAMVTPMLDISIEKYGFHLESICQAGLMMPFIYENEKFYLLCSFFREQTLKKDRQPQTIAKIPLNRDKKKSWQTCEKIIGKKRFNHFIESFKPKRTNKNNYQKRKY